MSNTVKIVTFNIRCSYDSFDGINAFVHRAGLVLDKIDSEKPDIICFQEVTPPHASLLKRSLKDYTVIYNGRLENFDGEGLCILVRDGVELISHDFFWLSPTPRVPASRFVEDQSECPRIATATMLNKNRKRFLVYNAHLDHEGTSARVKGTSVLLDRVKADNELYDLPVFIMGDFNDFPNSECLKEYHNFSYPKLTDLTDKISITFHNYGRIEDYCKIDYIFADEKTAPSCTQGVAWEENKNGIYLSDHYPVAIEWNVD